MDSATSSGGDTLAGDTVVIQVPADGPYGIKLRSDDTGNAAVIHSFEKLPSGKFGPIQKHGGIHYGDVLCEINNTKLSTVPHAEAVQMLSNRNTLKKILKFQSPKVYYRSKNTLSYKAQPSDAKNNFLSAIKQSRISESGGKKYVDYEIACQYRLVGFKVQTEVVYQWSVWKRYSEFEAMHSAIKKALGWQMDGIELPSAHTFVMNKMAPEFIDQRRDDLKDYWQKIVAIDKITDFAKHHCSNDLKLFLQVDENTKDKEVAATADMIGDAALEEGAEGAGGAGGGNARRATSPTSATAAGGAPARRGSVRLNSRRISTKSLAAVNNGLAITDAPSATPATNTNATPASPTAATATAVANAPEEAAVSPPPPPPPRPSAPPAPISAPAAAPAGLPPKTPARANLLGSINALRKD